MYAILYRVPANHETVLFESDDLGNAVALLVGIVQSTIMDLIDFSGNLDGYLDRTLQIMDSIKIGYPVGVTV